MALTLRQIEYAVALADERNFRRAAEACFVTQPSLSVQIARLENDLGVVLFERGRGGAITTPAGREFITRARSLLRDVRDLDEMMQRLRAPLSGHLRVGIISTIAPYLLPGTVPRVLHRFPDLQLYLREEKTAPLLEHLARGHLDVLVLALEADLGEVDTLPLFHDAFYLAAPTGHPLLAHRRVPLSALADTSLLLLDDGHCLRDQTIELCKPAGVHEQASFRASSLSTLVQMVASGLGVTLLPEMAIKTERRNRRIVTRPLAGHAPGRTVGLAWRKGSMLEASYRAFGKAMRDGWHAAHKKRTRQ